ncbi:DNA-directed RNA polymerase III subunit RPC7 [Eumeta japonica]|uniref:DNA-directed RNA polymerase III subunit n=1 Tax=Eumeta variegata TaxID=151549 RepID=A0A4C1XWD6_EUMVA|nr:DNA-directed RNA polymerase III subunit RPC7 [Eumeta japonica]
MAGRGRGRGSTLSLTHEQLQALGIGRGDNTGSAIAPPPLFPKLETKALPLQSDAATEYMLVVKSQFIEYLHESPAYVTKRTRADDTERYSDKYKMLALDVKQSRILDCIWSNIPAELRPLAQRTKPVSRKRKLEDLTAITKKLQTLEKKESQEDSSDVQLNVEEDVIKKEGESDDEELEEEQEQEYEVDEGTDYANNYFDNGEDYDDEDDNLDDGPVY